MASQDAFYMLPDSLLSFILSKIPIREAVKCCILSKRWRFLYTMMPTLTFSVESVLGPNVLERDVHYTMSKAENIISNILLLHSHNLKALCIQPSYFDLDNHEWPFSNENVCTWVRYAASCNVQHLTLDHCDSGEMSPPALFACSHLVTLRLTGYFLTRFPTNFVGFPHLISCYLHDVQLTDESLVSLIALCPLLQKLEIRGYSGLGHVDIFSSTIEHLHIEYVNYLSVNCPKLNILEGLDIMDLQVNGLRPFYELCDNIRKLEMHRGDTLRALFICFSGCISASRFLHIVGNLQSLEKLDIYMCRLDIFMRRPFKREKERDVPLLNLLYMLPNLQSLSIRGSFVQELARSPIPDCFTSPHANLKKIRIQIVEFDHKEVAVIRCFLQSTPFLERMEIELPKGKRYKCQSVFFKDILYLRRASSLARIIVDV